MICLPLTCAHACDTSLSYLLALLYYSRLDYVSGKLIRGIKSEQLVNSF